MPQLNPAYFTPQLVWLAITFIVFFLLMWRLALPRVASVMQKREEKIANDLDRAQELKTEAVQIMAAYDKALSEARAEAHAVARKAADEMSAQAAAKSAEIGAAVAEKVKSAESRIAAARSQALGHVREVAGEVAQAAVVKLVGSAPAADRLGAAVDKVLTERSR